MSGGAASVTRKHPPSPRDVGFRVTRLAILGIFVLIGIIPMVWLALAPSKTGPELQSLSPFAFGSVDNYFVAWNNLQSFADAVILRWTFNSFFYTSVIVFVSVSSATLAGFVLAATRLPFRRAWLMITLLAMLIPPVAWCCHSSSRSRPWGCSTRPGR